MRETMSEKMRKAVVGWLRLEFFDKPELLVVLNYDGLLFEIKRIRLEELPTEKEVMPRAYDADDAGKIHEAMGYTQALADARKIIEEE